MSLALIRNIVLNRWRNRGDDAPKICLFLGAGADISSGGLTFTEFKRLCLEELSSRRQFVITTPEEIDRRFEALFENELFEDDRVLAAERVFRRMSALVPSDAYKLLVLLAETRAIDAVVTTNFDTMLEAAQEMLGINVFQVYSPGLARPFPVPRRPFQLPKLPYIKLHGDLGSGSLSFVTSDELEHPDYDPSVRALLKEIVRSHDMIFAGYSGLDAGLARLIGPLMAGGAHRIFWCDPRQLLADAPLHLQLGRHRYTFVKTDFDHLVAEIARPVLEHPRASHTEPVYVPTLLEWRVDYCNREYHAEVGRTAGPARPEPLIRRVEVETQLDRFLASPKPLAVVAGPSGFGKSTLGLRLHSSWGRDPMRRVLLLRAKTFTAPDLEMHVAAQLGALGPAAPPSIALLERWLEITGRRLVVYVDGLNEYSSEIDECVRLFRNITRVAYFLPEQSAIKIIVTVRQETWAALQPSLDRTQLEYSLWTESTLDRSVSAIPIGLLSHAELRAALAHLPSREADGALAYDTLLPATIERLRDPYFLAALREANMVPHAVTSDAALYREIFDRKLRRGGGRYHPATLADALASLALLCLDRRADEFRRADAWTYSIDDGGVRTLKDLSLLSETSDGLLRFAHDRTQQYFLAQGLRLAGGPELATLGDVALFLQHTAGDEKAREALRMYFVLDLDATFPLIEHALGPERLHLANAAQRELVLRFARDMLLELAVGNPGFLGEYIEAALSAFRSSSTLSAEQLRILVQAAAHLPADVAVPLLGEVEHCGDSLAATEANIYATDRIAKRLLAEPATVRLHEAEPYRSYYFDPQLPVWRRLGRLLGLMSQLGPDNTHPTEYAQVRETVVDALGRVTPPRSFGDADVAGVARFILEGRDRYLFNATLEGIRRFFDNPDRGRFVAILDRLDGGGVLEHEDIVGLRPYLASLDFNLEFQLTNFLYVLSARNDFAATLALWRETCDAFTDETAPEFVDFHHAVAVHLYLMNDRPYDDLLEGYTEKALATLPSVLLYRPGLKRGYQRGYRDEFDMVFEDGFNPVASYAMLRPARWRTRLRAEEYRESGGGREEAAPLFMLWLNRFLSEGRFDEALRILHALSQVAVLWPREGLWALRDVVGHPDPRIHRATIRILAETYNRHPHETRQFLHGSGSMLSDADLAEITVHLDPQVGRRQFELLEWGRVFAFLLELPGGREALIRGLRSVFQAPSVEAAVAGVLRELGLYAPAADR